MNLENELGEAIKFFGFFSVLKVVFFTQNDRKLWKVEN